MSYIKPQILIAKVIDVGASKVEMPISQAFICAFMAGAILALAAAFAITVTVNTGQPLLGAVLFPVGFCLLYLLGFDLLTGVFTLVPLALLDGRPGVTVSKMLKNWTIVFFGNFTGAFTVAVGMSIVFTYSFTVAPDLVAQKIGHIGETRTVGYKDHGAAGFVTLFIRGVFCNWMVSTAVVGALMSTTTSGKVIVMWMPIMVFFYMGFEHSIVNMFLFPSGIMLGGEFNVSDYLLWNEIPTVFGNLIGGFIFVGLPLYLAFAKKNETFQRDDAVAEFQTEMPSAHH